VGVFGFDISLCCGRLQKSGEIIDVVMAQLTGKLVEVGPEGLELVSLWPD
jgi:hypothetical protein